MKEFYFLKKSNVFFITGYFQNVTIAEHHEVLGNKKAYINKNNTT